MLLVGHLCFKRGNPNKHKLISFNCVGSGLSSPVAKELQQFQPLHFSFHHAVKKGNLCWNSFSLLCYLLSLCGQGVWALLIWTNSEELRRNSVIQCLAYRRPVVNFGGLCEVNTNLNILAVRKREVTVLGRKALRKTGVLTQHPSARKIQGAGRFSNCGIVIIFQLETMNSCQYYLFWNIVSPMSLLFKEKSNFYSILSSLESISHRSYHRFTVHAGHAKSGCGDVLAGSSCEIKTSISFICKEKLGFQMRSSFSSLQLMHFFSLHSELWTRCFCKRSRTAQKWNQEVDAVTENTPSRSSTFSLSR